MRETSKSEKERYERAEYYLKGRLDEVYEKMKIVDDKNHLISEVSLKEIFAEWMNYLVKTNHKSKDKNNLLDKRLRFILERNTDAVADLIKGFFEAKRRYGRDIERGEEWNRQALCKNYCAKYQRYNDENILHSFFSSYSAAERRIRTKVKEGKLLASTSNSLFDTLQNVKDEEQKKEDEKKRKEKEREKQKAEKLRKKEEREMQKAEKAQLKSEKETAKAKKTKNIKNDTATNEHNISIIDEGAINHYGGNDDNIIDENGDIVPNFDKLNSDYNNSSTEESNPFDKQEENHTSSGQKDKHAIVPIPKRIKAIKANPNDLQLFDEDGNPTIEALVESNNEK